jgi:hypothetical protein
MEHAHRTLAWLNVELEKRGYRTKAAKAEAMGWSPSLWSFIETGDRPVPGCEKLVEGARSLFKDDPSADWMATLLLLACADNVERKAGKPDPMMAQLLGWFDRLKSGQKVQPCPHGEIPVFQFIDRDAPLPPTPKDTGFLQFIPSTKDDVKAGAFGLAKGRDGQVAFRRVPRLRTLEIYHPYRCQRLAQSDRVLIRGELDTLEPARIKVSDRILVRHYDHKRVAEGRGPWVFRPLRGQIVAVLDRTIRHQGPRGPVG